MAQSIANDEIFHCRCVTCETNTVLVWDIINEVYMSLCESCNTFAHLPADPTKVSKQ